jgi:hypothetical protein
MPIETAILLTVVVLVFVLFGATLAWGERQTRDLPRSDAKQSPQP